MTCRFPDETVARCACGSTDKSPRPRTESDRPTRRCLWLAGTGSSGTCASSGSSSCPGKKAKESLLWKKSTIGERYETKNEPSLCCCGTADTRSPDDKVSEVSCRSPFCSSPARTRRPATWDRRSSCYAPCRGCWDHSIQRYRSDTRLFRWLEARWCRTQVAWSTLTEMLWVPKTLAWNRHFRTYLKSGWPWAKAQWAPFFMHWPRASVSWTHIQVLK